MRVKYPRTPHLLCSLAVFELHRYFLKPVRIFMPDKKQNVSETTTLFIKEYYFLIYAFKGQTS
jgi:hypothetical protein